MAALAFTVFLQAAGSVPLWWDEAATVSVATRSPGDIWSVLQKTDMNMGAYYFGLHGLLDLTGVSSLALRLPSVIAITATIVFSALVARRLFNPRVGLLTGVFVATSTVLIEAAHEARAYAVGTGLVALVTWLFVVAVQDRRRRTVVAYAVVLAAALYIVPTVAFIVPVHVVALLLAREKTWTKWCVVYAAVAVAVAPVIVGVWSVGAGQVSYQERPGLAALLARGWELAGGVAQDPSGGWSWQGNVLAAVVVALAATGAATLVVRARHGLPAWKAGLVVGWALVPILGLWVASQVQPLFAVRYINYSLPGVAALAAVGLLAVVEHWRHVSVVALVVVTGAVVVGRLGPQPYQWAISAEDAAASRFIEAHVRPGDVLLFSPEWRRPLAEWNLGGVPGQRLRLPLDVIVARNGRSRDDLWATQIQTGTIGGKMAGASRVWILRWTSDAPSPTFQVAFTVTRDQFTFARSRDFGRARVSLYIRA
jgi:mannosyltransferase